MLEMLLPVHISGTGLLLLRCSQRLYSVFYFFVWLLCTKLSGMEYPEVELVQVVPGFISNVSKPDQAWQLNIHFFSRPLLREYIFMQHNHDRSIITLYLVFINLLVLLMVSWVDDFFHCAF